MYPLFRLMPALYNWGVRRRIVRMYSDLRDLETGAASLDAGAPIDELNAGLDRLEDKARHLHVPLFCSDALYTLRVHIALVRERIKGAGGPPAAS
jgi:hypothetical protein